MPLRRISQAVVLEPDGIATVSRLRGMVGGVSQGQALHPSGCVYCYVADSIAI